MKEPLLLLKHCPPLFLRQVLISPWDHQLSWADTVHMSESPQHWNYKDVQSRPALSLVLGLELRFPCSKDFTTHLFILDEWVWVQERTQISSECIHIHLMECTGFPYGCFFRLLLGIGRDFSLL